MAIGKNGDRAKCEKTCLGSYGPLAYGAFFVRHPGFGMSEATAEFAAEPGVVGAGGAVSASSRPRETANIGRIARYRASSTRLLVLAAALAAWVGEHGVQGRSTSLKARQVRPRSGRR